MAQKTTAVNNDDIAYTSASTAENQKESVNVNDKAPVNPDSIIRIVLFRLSVFMIFEVRCVMVQNKKSIVNSLDSTLKKLIANAIFSRFPKAKSEKNLPSKR